MSALNLASKYAQALFETAQPELRTKIIAELKQLVPLFDKSIVEFFQSPHNTIETKKSVLNMALEGKTSPEVFNFMHTLVLNERLAVLDKIAAEFEKLGMTSLGATRGTLWAATEVGPEFIKKVEEQATKAIGRKVELKFERRPELVAGFKVQVGGWTLDDSAAAHLRILKDDLMKRGL